MCVCVCRKGRQLYRISHFIVYDLPALCSRKQDRERIMEEKRERERDGEREKRRKSARKEFYFQTLFNTNCIVNQKPIDIVIQYYSEL